ncbi:MAG: amidohydrolase family protein [Clostridia bacterium]|nr:amidohydrolase family protein [Clostridia bacterium]
MIIDTHVHIGEMLGFDMPEQMVLDSMKKYNIDYSLVSNIQAAEYDSDLNIIPTEQQISQTESLERSLKFARENPDKIGVFHWIKPAFEKVDDKLENMIKDNLDVIHGIKVHPYHSKTALDDPKLEPYLQLAEKYNLPVAAHTGGCEEANSIHVYNAAIKHPNINFVMVHLGLGTDNKESIELLGKADNLYGDTTWVPMEHIIDAVNKFGSEKILFGSDNPIDGLDTYHNNPKGDISIYPAYFNDLKGIIGEKNYNNIMYRNAIKLFNLKF